MENSISRRFVGTRRQVDDMGSRGRIRPPSWIQRNEISDWNMLLGWVRVLSLFRLESASDAAPLSFNWIVEWQLTKHENENAVVCDQVLDVKCNLRNRFVQKCLAGDPSKMAQSTRERLQPTVKSANKHLTRPLIRVTRANDSALFVLSNSLP